MRSRNDRVIAFLMLLPSLIAIAIFVYYFIGRTVQTSLTDWGEDQINKPPLQENVDKDYVGTDNYKILMTRFIPEFRFRNSLINTFFFTVLFMAGCLVLGFLLAMMLDRGIVGEAFFRTTFLFPMSLSLVVTGTIWNWLLQPGGGINVLPEKLFGRDPLSYRWISSTTVELQFAWGDVPRYITYLGLAILGFVAFNYLSQENDRVGRISSQILQLIIVAAITIGVISLFWGYDDLTPLWGAFVGLVSVIFRIVWSGEASEGPDYVHREWRPVRYMAVAGVLVVLVYASGLWDKIWLPLEFPAAETAIPKGYNAALSGIIIAAVWQMSGYTMAMFLAGIRGIPEELREAARVDGCSEWGVYRSIILPLLRPVTLSAMIVLGHISLKVFDLVITMSKADNPYTIMPGVMVYLSFRNNRFANAAAVAVIMLILVSLVIIPYLWYSQRQEAKR